MTLQAAIGPAPPLEERLRAAPRCPADPSIGEVVVCARRDQPYRLLPLPDRYADKGPRKAETRVGPGVLTAEGEAASIGGIPVNRAMIRLKIPF